MSVTAAIKLDIAIEALREIRDFDHDLEASGFGHAAPVHECGCRVMDEREIARAALERID